MFKSKSSATAADASAAVASHQLEIEALDKELLISMLCEARCITPMTRAEARIAEIGRAHV